MIAHVRPPLFARNSFVCWTNPSRFAWSLTPPSPPAAQARPLKGGASRQSTFGPRYFPSVRPSVPSFDRSFAASRNCAREKSDGKIFPAFCPRRGGREELSRGIVKNADIAAKVQFISPSRPRIRAKIQAQISQGIFPPSSRFQGRRHRWLTNCFLPPATQTLTHTQTTGPQDNTTLPHFRKIWVLK